MKNIKLKTIKYLGLGLVLAVGLTTAAKAALEDFTWVQGTDTGGTSVDSSSTSYGSLVYDTSTDTISDYTFVVSGPQTISDILLNPTGPGVGTILSDNDLDIGEPSGTVQSGPSLGNWVDGPVFGLGNNEDLFNFNVGGAGAILTGDWVPTAVPEPTTLVAGALLLLPFGASTLRIVRKNRAA